MHANGDHNGRATCGATNRNGTKCNRPAGWGTDHTGYGHCRNHSGSTPTGRKHGQRLMAQHAAVTFGLPVAIGPHEALEQELHRAAGIVAWLSVEVAALAENEVTSPVGGGENSHPRYEPNVLIDMYGAERDRLHAVAKTCHAVGIEDRRIHLVEQQGQLLASVVRGVLTDITNDEGTPLLDVPGTAEIVRKHLTTAAQSGD